MREQGISIRCANFSLSLFLSLFFSFLFLSLECVQLVLRRLNFQIKWTEVPSQTELSEAVSLCLQFQVEVLLLVILWLSVSLMCYFLEPKWAMGQCIYLDQPL